MVSCGEKSQDLYVDRWCRGPEFLKSYKCEWEVNNRDLSLSIDDPEVKDSKKMLACLLLL